VTFARRFPERGFLAFTNGILIDSETAEAAAG